MAVPISNVTRRTVYAPSGSGGAGPYSFTFEILANTDIAVYKDDTLLTLTTHYTVTINANGTGSVLINATGLALAPVSPTQYAVVGNRTIQRTTDFTTGGDFFANTINDELDQQTIFAQQNAEGLARALSAPQTDPTSINMTLPAKASRALKTLSFDVNGNPTPGVSASDVANAVTYATNAANSATAAASSASAASSSASAASSSASTASTQASNASTSASNASTSASGASTSATAAAGSASTASTQASNASTSATNAASSASAASTSAANAATSATNASNSASTASTQASNAATSATSAGTSATSAANSAAAAASALDSFDDRYLGTKSSDPTLDNDGNALVSGALYFSTTQNVMKVYDGASWITATSAGATSLIRFRYVATSGQTTFSGADAASATLTYTVNNIVVMRNGVTLDTSEYTASNGTSIVLGVAAGTGDIVDIVAFKSFTVADALSAVSGGTVNGAVTIVGALTNTAGTANGVAYLNGSKVLTTGSALTFSGTVLSVVGGGYTDAIGGGNIQSADGTRTLGLTANFTSSTPGIYSLGANPIAFYTNSTEKMRLDSSGNLGLGVTPSAWGGSSKAIQVQRGTLNSYANLDLQLGQNYYYDGTNNKYVANGFASYYSQYNGSHIWNIAPSGTAGNNITFTQAMTLDASGNLLVGVSSSNFASGTGLQVNNPASADTRLKVSNAGTGSGQFDGFDLAVTSAGQVNLIGWENQPMTFLTNATERARIDSSGRLLVGTTGVLVNESTFGATSVGNTATFKTTGGAGTNPLLVWNSGTTGTREMISFSTGASFSSQGGITSNGSVLTYGGTSDYRLKEISGAVTGYKERLMALQPKQGVWKTDGSDFRGFLAHEFAQSYPASVIGEKDAVDADGNPKHQSMQASTAEVMADLVALVQEQQALITQLTARITALEGA